MLQDYFPLQPRVFQGNPHCLTCRDRPSHERQVRPKTPVNRRRQDLCREMEAMRPLDGGDVARPDLLEVSATVSISLV